MVAAVIQNTKPWWQHFAFNWFDLALVLVLAFGFWRGRKRGMTKELLPTLQWLAILLGAGFGHIYLADWLQQRGFVRQVFGNHFNERTAALMSAYLAIALVIFIVFTVLKQKYNPKLEGSNFFGGNEYYWGVAAGLMRYGSIVLVARALLNAPLYTAQEITQHQQRMMDSFGLRGAQRGNFKSADISGDYLAFLYPPNIQEIVFKDSLVGPLIKDNLSMLLINTVDNAKKTAHS